MSLASSEKKVTIVNSLLSGVTSSVITTIAYQPLELLRTRLQLRESRDQLLTNHNRVIGSATKSALKLIKDNDLLYLWRGTGAALVRYVPGVSLYFASLNILQSNFSQQTDRPHSRSQAFCFGVISRSFISFILLPVTVVKVRYESGRYKYYNLATALSKAYTNNGWVGIGPTLMRDSLFSGIYLVLYTELKNSNVSQRQQLGANVNFVNGIISGFIASIITNPLEVLKTNIQAGSSGERSMLRMAGIIKKNYGYARFLDGLLLRTFRRTLVSATTWTIYELIVNLQN